MSRGLRSNRSTSPLRSRIHLRGRERHDPEGDRAAIWAHPGTVCETLLPVSDPDLSLSGKAGPRKRALRQIG